MPKKVKKKESGILKAVKKVLGKNPDKKTRGHYKQKECPYCHMHVGNLGNHIRLKHPLEDPESVSVIERRAFMKLPIEKRRQILKRQAQKIADYYKEELNEIEGGDIVEY